MAHIFLSRATRSGLASNKQLMSFACRGLARSVNFELPTKRAVIIGVHETQDKSIGDFASKQAEHYCTTESKLTERLARSGPLLKEGQVRLINTTRDGDDLVVLVGLGQKDRSNESSNEGHDLAREAVRAAVSSGIRSLKHYGVEEVLVDPCGDEEAAAEGAHLALWSYDFLKSKKEDLKKLKIKSLGDENQQGWQTGTKKAKGQNFARTLMEAPANYMTPQEFAKAAKNQLQPLGVEVIPRDLSWIKSQNMGSFLSVSQGSREDPVFLEMSLANGGDSQSIVFVGKGVTFDTGGISIKPSKDMDKMRGDMGGAACVTGSIYAAASLKLPINLKVLIPLCENMPGGNATKPGDVVIAKNGKTIQVDNTDAEGRLILADALCYADTFAPKLVLDVATLTGAMAVAIGGSACGVYSTSDLLFKQLQDAAFKTGDRVWRMPLWKFYSEQMKKSPTADLNNISSVPYGGSCTAAAFLREFVTCQNWMHLDIAGVMHNHADVKYLPPGMAGRPTRTLIEFLQSLSQQ